MYGRPESPPQPTKQTNTSSVTTLTKLPLTPLEKLQTTNPNLRRDEHPTVHRGVLLSKRLMCNTIARKMDASAVDYENYLERESIFARCQAFGRTQDSQPGFDRDGIANKSHRPIAEKHLDATWMVTTSGLHRPTAATLDGTQFFVASMGVSARWPIGQWYHPGHSHWVAR